MSDTNILTCVYCGHAYPEGTPPHGSKVLTDHIKICDKHPMKKLVDENKKLRGALLAFAGVTTKDEIRGMKDILKLDIVPASPGVDKNVVLEALDVLLETEE